MIINPTFTPPDPPLSCYFIAIYHVYKTSLINHVF